MRRSSIFLAATVAVGTLTSAVAQTSRDDRDAGRLLAQKNCSGCHLVADGQRRRPVPGVPTFSEIARRSTSEMSVRAFSQPPHPPLSDVSLRRRQVDEIVRYVLDLREQMKSTGDSCCGRPSLSLGERARVPAEPLAKPDGQGAGSPREGSREPALRRPLQ